MVEIAMDCTNCKGGCCCNVLLPLSPEEIGFLEVAGTQLQNETPDEIDELYEVMGEQTVYGRIPVRGKRVGIDIFIDLGRKEKAMLMDGECGYLEPVNEEGWRRCGMVDDERRPNVCNTFSVGSECCGLARARVVESVV